MLETDGTRLETGTGTWTSIGLGTGAVTRSSFRAGEKLFAQSTAGGLELPPREDVIKSHGRIVSSRREGVIRSDG